MFSKIAIRQAAMKLAKRAAVDGAVVILFDGTGYRLAGYGAGKRHLSGVRNGLNIFRGMQNLAKAMRRAAKNIRGAPSPDLESSD